MYSENAPVVLPLNPTYKNPSLLSNSRYGYDTCDVECDEKVVVGSEEIMMDAHPGIRDRLGSFDINKGPENPKSAEYLTKAWTLNTKYELEKR